MRIVACIVFLACSITAFSQFDDLNRSRQFEEFKKKNQDTLFRRKLLDERYQRDKANGVLRLPKSLPYQNKRMQRDTLQGMPVLKFKLKGEYIGNNGKGADIYAMNPDNMPCLAPDSTYRSRMPVAKSGRVMKVEKNEGIKPDE